VNTAALLEEVFHDCFLDAFDTRLQGGADEPVYRPGAGGPACIHYREDFAASLLHEVAHWCIAGRERRLLEDYGYWYLPDGRNPAQQAAFEQAEARPQALEWHFSLACRLPFRVSLDNLGGQPGSPAAFRVTVAAEARRLCREGLPSRGERFRAALAKRFGGPGRPTPALFSAAEADC
jgi:hypothetical protein